MAHTVGAWQVNQGRLGRYIVVPDVVVRGLETPARPACLGIQGKDGVTVLVVERAALSAVIVRRGASHWQVHQTECFIGTDRRPAVG